MNGTDVALGCVYGECPIDVSARLVELDGLPSILGRLADRRALNHAWVVLVSALHVLPVDVTLNLILTEPKGEIKLEGLIVLARGRFLEAPLVLVRGCACPTLRCAPRILGAMVV